MQAIIGPPNMQAIIGPPNMQAIIGSPTSKPLLDPQHLRHHWTPAYLLSLEPQHAGLYENLQTRKPVLDIWPPTCEPL